MTSPEDKLPDAVRVIHKCQGRRGFYASADRCFYRGQYWTRDVCFSAEGLRLAGLSEQLKRHLEFVLSHTKSGRVPTAYMTPLTFWLWGLGWGYKFTDQVDNELLVLYCLRNHVAGLGADPKNEELVSGKTCEVWEYVRSRMDENCVIFGRDWRDAMGVYRRKATFLNMALLYAVAEGGLKAKVAASIEKYFYIPSLGYYADFLDKAYTPSPHFDVLAHALAIIHDAVPEGRLDQVLKGFHRASTPYGYRNINPPYRWHQTGAFALIPGFHYQNGGVWGFIQGYAVLALLKAGKFKEALEEFKKMCAWKGFNEWYDPETGKPKGSKNQLWTAALWITCYHALKAQGCI